MSAYANIVLQCINTKIIFLVLEIQISVIKIEFCLAEVESFVNFYGSRMY